MPIGVGRWSVYTDYNGKTIKAITTDEDLVDDFNNGDGNSFYNAHKKLRRFVIDNQKINGMANKSDNIFVRAKAYVKAHPRTSFQDAIQKVKGKKTVSGVKRKSSAKAKVATRKPKKETVTKTTRVTATVGRAVGRIGSVNGTEKTGLKLLNNINRLTVKLKTTKGADARNFIKRLINAEHDKLDLLTKKLKRA